MVFLPACRARRSASFARCMIYSSVFARRTAAASTPTRSAPFFLAMRITAAIGKSDIELHQIQYYIRQCINFFPFPQKFRLFYFDGATISRLSADGDEIGGKPGMVSGGRPGPARSLKVPPPLPDLRDEPVPHFLTVFGVSREVPCQHLFLVPDPKDQKYRQQEEDGQCPEGAQGRGGGQEHHDEAQVHGVPDQGIGACGNHPLPGFDLNDAGGKTVLPEDQEDKEVAQEHHSICREHKGNRYRRPSEPVIQPRDQESQEEQDTPEDLDLLLGGLLLPESHPPLKASGISFEKVVHDKDQQYKEDPKVRPCLPVVQGACGNKEHQGYDKESSGEPNKDGLP